MKIDLDDNRLFLLAGDIADEVMDLVSRQRWALVGVRHSRAAIEMQHYTLDTVRQTVRGIKDHKDRLKFLGFVRIQLADKRTYIRGRDFVAAIAAAPSFTWPIW